MRDTIAALEAEFWRYKALGDSALAQLDDDLVSRVPAGESNSVAVIVWHLAGNFESRFTDFLDADGEKPWRDRDAEFEPRTVTQPATVARWQQGWAVVLPALAGLRDIDLPRHVTVRGQKLTRARGGEPRRWRTRPITSDRSCSWARCGATSSGSA